MSNEPHTPLGSRLYRKIVQGSASERGNALVFGMFIFIVLMMSSGMAIDFMRHETERTQLQSTLDRAVLAAADLDQKNDPEAVVRDYFAKSTSSGYTLSVDVQGDEGGRSVGATVQSPVQSMFLNMLGIDTMDAPARGRAGETLGNVEISLVLDISDSMMRNNRLANMQLAATSFVDQVLTDETKDRVSISLVPYSGLVNAGPDLFAHININQVHDYSHCVEFQDDDYISTAMIPDKVLEQAQHIDIANGGGTPNKVICPQEVNDRIAPLQNSAEKLKAQINAFRTRPFTGSQHAMKWATALLDPSMRTAVSALVADGKIPASFAGRPFNYDEGGVQKVIVLMTDGRNYRQQRLKPEYYDTEEERAEAASKPLKEIYGNSGMKSRLVKIQEGKTRVGDRKSANENLADICNAARANHVIVFTVGFELDDEDATRAIKECASSDAHAYSVSGGELTNTFSAIAGTLQQLRLLQ